MQRHLGFYYFGDRTPKYCPRQQVVEQFDQEAGLRGLRMRQIQILDEPRIVGASWFFEGENIAVTRYQLDRSSIARIPVMMLEVPYFLNGTQLDHIPGFGLLPTMLGFISMENVDGLARAVMSGLAPLQP